MDKELRRLGYGEAAEVPDDAWSPIAAAALDAIKNARHGASSIPPAYRPTISELSSQFVNERQRDLNSKLTEQTRVQMEAVYRLFRDHTHDAPLASLDRTTVASFFDRLARLPPNWGRQKSAKKLTLNQLLAGAKGSGGLAPKTINRYVSALSQLWKWAEKRGEVDGPNPFVGFHQRARRNKEAHVPWTAPAIATYFRLYSRAGPEGDPDPFHWLPKVAVLSGMRLDEICSLEVTDIKTAEGVTYFDIAEGKTDSAVRAVPIHSKLMALIKLAPAAGYLFPHLTPGGPDRKRSWNIGRRLNRRFKAIEGASDFHGLRKTVSQTFERLGVPESSTAQILGHFRPGMTYGVYSPNGLTIQQRKRLIEKLGAELPEE